MTRLQRIDPKMGWHHVTNHAAGRDDLFTTDEGRHGFLRLLVWAAARTSVEVVGFCLMGNHFHLILHCPEGRLSEFMQLVESVYARALIARRGFRGPVFVDRFHNTVIINDEQLLVATRYVDRNPLELGLDIEKYQWSSYQAHVYGTGEHDSALSRSAAFPVQLCGGPAAYKRFVCTDGPSDKFPITAGRRVVPSTPYVAVEAQLMAIAQAAAITSGSTYDQVIRPCGAARSSARLAAVHVASSHRVAFANELCDFFGYAARSSLTSASKRAKRKLATHVEFKALVEQVEFAWNNGQELKAS